MRIHCGKGWVGKLNRIIWPKHLNPKLTAIEPDGLFCGIGTMLGEHMVPASRYLVFGAGAGYSGAPHLGPDSRIDFVRGPMTSANMGWVRSITDPAILVSEQYAKGEVEHEIAFLPRADRRRNPREDGIAFIDPARDAHSVIGDISRCDLLLTESLHGAIVADSLRVPWISMYVPDHNFKWHDWCRSMNMVWNPIDESLDWARKLAVPQLSADSVRKHKVRAILECVDKLNQDIESGRVFA